MKDITLSQPAYIEKIVEKFLSAEDLASKRQWVLTPMVFDDIRLSSGDEKRIDQVEYLEMVGSLNYLAQYSRTNILFSVSVLAQRSSKPTVRDMLHSVRPLEMRFG